MDEAAKLRIAELGFDAESFCRDIADHKSSLRGEPSVYCGTYAKYGDGDLSASALYEIAQAMNVDLALLLTGDAPKMSVFTVTRKDKGVSVNRRSQYAYQALAANLAGKKAEPFVVTVPTTERDARITLNAHPGQEMDYVLEGTLKVVIHGNEVVLNPGDSIYFDSSHPHGMASIGDIPAKFLAIIM